VTGSWITPGSIIPFGGDPALVPVGWLPCDGSPVAIASYPDLYAVIGTAWGGDGIGTFNIPDLRGRFLRGVDGGAGLDPDAGDRNESAAGGNTGDAVGTVQADQNQGHEHDLQLPVTGPSGAATPTGFERAYNQGNIYSGATTTQGGAEARPVNAAVEFIIKY